MIDNSGECMDDDSEELEDGERDSSEGYGYGLWVRKGQMQKYSGVLNIGMMVYCQNLFRLILNIKY